MAIGYSLVQLLICRYAVIASNCAACPQLRCERPGCGTLFCYHCKGQWHASQTCDEARKERGGLFRTPLPQIASSSVDNSLKRIASIIFIVLLRMINDL